MAIFGVNHIDLHSTEPDQLREFYADLLDAEELQGFHDPLRVGAMKLAFHALEPGGVIGGVEVAFDVDARGYDDTLGKAKRLGVIDGNEIRWNAAARSFYVRDPDGRRIEFLAPRPRRLMARMTERRSKHSGRATRGLPFSSSGR